MLSHIKKLTGSSLIIGISILMATACQPVNQQSAENVPPAQKQFATPELIHKADSVLSKMTLEEKAGQMTQFTSGYTTTGPTINPNYRKYIKEGRVGSIFNAVGWKYTKQLQEIAVDSTRLHIPILFGFDVIHGFRTIFPINLAESCTWDPDLVRQADSVAAAEAASEGLQWTFAPMVDISRDPRWGRVMEGAGEDPYLGSKIAAAAVHGFQGHDLSATNTVLACVKHFAAYGAVEAGREYNSVDMSMRRLRSMYLPTYKAAVDAGAATVMTSFNTLNGVPSTENHFLLTKVLRNEWGFKGFVVTDYTAIMELRHHEVAKDSAQAALRAVKAGVDMDMQSGYFMDELPKLVREGKISETLLNNAVREILITKFKLGLFKNPYAYSDSLRAAQTILTQSSRQLARKIADKSMVLLKNDGHLLPLSKNVHSIALIGPLANDQEDLLGSWSGAGEAKDVVSVLQGMKEAVSSGTQIHYVKGTDIKGTSEAGFPAAVAAARRSDVTVMVIGESRNMTGEAASRSKIGVPGNQVDLVKAVMKTGKPVVVVLMNGRPLTVDWLQDHVPAILEAWYPGIEGGHALSDVLFGDYNPSGKLTMEFPRDVGQIPLYYNHLNTGRPANPNNKYTSKYLDVPNSPLYPFGYGLSYTTFSYTAPQLSATSMSPSDSLTVTTTVTNTGKVAGEEVVQMYLHEHYNEVSPPVKELKGFTHVMLQPGQSQKVTFNITPEKLEHYNINMKKVISPGAYSVMIGTRSDSVKSAVFNVTGNTSD